MFLNFVLGRSLHTYYIPADLVHLVLNLGGQQHQPRHASVLVTTGIYRFTRNPMYLGLLFLLIGWAVYLGSILGFLPLALFVLYMNRFQIEPEERALSVAFGQGYLIYRREVRRWI